MRRTVGFLLIFLIICYAVVCVQPPTSSGESFGSTAVNNRVCLYLISEEAIDFIIVFGTPAANLEIKSTLCELKSGATRTIIYNFHTLRGSSFSMRSMNSVLLNINDVSYQMKTGRVFLISGENNNNVAQLPITFDPIMSHPQDAGSYIKIKLLKAASKDRQLASFIEG